MTRSRQLARRLTSTLLGAVAVLPVAVAVGPTVGGVADAAPVARPSVTPAAAAPARFRATSPSRILDTRRGSTLSARGRTELSVAAVAAPGATSVLLNVTVTRPKATGYVTAYAAGATRPATSNLTFTPGATVANAVVASVGVGGKINFYNGSAGAVDLVVDLEGSYVPPATASGGYVGLAPARLLDTRSGRGGHTPAAGATIAVPTAGLGGVAENASAAVVTLTATRATAPGYLTAWASGTASPTTSNVVFRKGVTVSTTALVPIGSNGRISLRNGSTRPVDALVDVVGYLTAGSSPATGSTVPLHPARVLDTRATAAAAANTAVPVTLPGHSGVPSEHADAVVLTVTATRATEPGFLSVYRYGDTRRTSSVLNYAAGQTVSNLVVLPLGTGGRIQVFNGSAGRTQVVVDVAGYVVADPAWHDETPVFPGSAPDIATETTYDGVSCWAAGQCVTVGHGPDGYFADSVVNGVTSRTVLGVPAGSGYAGMPLVSCASARCTIVRSVHRGGSDDVLAYTRGTSGWTSVDLGSPFGPPADSLTLSAVDCPVSGTCTVVGSLGDVRPDHFSVVHLEIAGGKLTLDTNTVDDGADQFPTGVSCRSTGNCFSSGYEIVDAGDGTTATSAFVERLQGGVWTRTAVSGAAPADARATGVSCRPAGDCLVIGVTGADQKPFATAVTGTTGAVTPVAAPPVRSGAVSCSATICVVVGADGDALHAAGFDGNVWTSTTVGAPAGGTAAPVYTGLSCPSDTSCVAVGDAAVHRDQHRQGMVSTYADGGWTTTSTVPPAGDPVGTADAVSCSPDGTCTVVGVRTTRYGTATFYARQRTQTGWSSVVDLPAPAERYDDVGPDGVACSSAASCVAVLGAPRVGSGESPAAAEILADGHWSLSVLPLPGGAAYSLASGVSCVAATHCVVVGQVVGGTASDGQPATWTWNGATWTVALIPLPVGVTTATPTAISCVTAEHCVVSASGGGQGLTLTLDSGTWTGHEVGGVATLSDVSCTSTTDCVAVGGTFAVTLADGTWTARMVTTVSLSRVSCRVAGFCAAISDRQFPSLAGVVLVRGVWSTTTFLPVGSTDGTGHAPLSDVSCGPQDCVAVGADTNFTGYAEVLA